MKKGQFHLCSAIKLSVSSAISDGEQGRRNGHRDKKVEQMLKNQRKLMLWGAGS